MTTTFILSLFLFLDVKELQAFLAKHPDMLKEFSRKDQIFRLRTKIFNERKVAREKLKKSTGKVLFHIKYFFIKFGTFK